MSAVLAERIECYRYADLLALNVWGFDPSAGKHSPDASTIYVPAPMLDDLASHVRACEVDVAKRCASRSMFGVRPIERSAPDAPNFFACDSWLTSRHAEILREDRPRTETC